MSKANQIIDENCKNDEELWKTNQEALQVNSSAKKSK